MTHRSNRVLTAARNVLLAGTAFIGFSTHAQDFPTRALTLLVPFSAGGATDVLARTIAEGLSHELKQTVIVENVPGAGGSVGQTKASRAHPDGYTMVLGNVGTLAANASLYTQLSYNILTDFTPVASVGDAPQVLSVRAGLPVNTFDEFVAYARANGPTMNFGTAGVGSGSFLGGVLLNAAIGANIPPVHYRGASQATADVMAGHIDFTIESSSTAVSSIASKKIKGLIVLRSERVEVLPDVPATSETAFPNLHYDIWNMVLVPKGVSPVIVGQLNAALNRALKSPAMTQRYAQMGVAVPSDEHRSLPGSAALLKSEVSRWKDALAKAGVQPDQK